MKDLVLVGDCAHLATVALHSLQREIVMLSLLSFIIEIDSVNVLLAFGVHTLHSLKKEKQLKIILTFTVSSIHN
jgi:hypothetical protein